MLVWVRTLAVVSSWVGWGSSPVQAGTGGGDPVAEAVAGIGQVAVPSQGCGAALFGVVGVQLMQVQRGQLPQQFGGGGSGAELSDSWR